MALVPMCFFSCAQGRDSETNKNNSDMILVAYFSATGTTEGVAKKIATATGGELLEIKPAEGYSSADLDWTDSNSRSSRESANPETRPAIVMEKDDIAKYNVVFLGYPIWWDEAPRVINSFIESFDFKGKTVVPFATSGSSGIGNSVRVLRKSYPSIKWQQGKLLNRATFDDVKRWVDGLGF